MPVSESHWSYLAQPAKTAASPRSLFNLVIPTQSFAQSSNPDGYFRIPNTVLVSILNPAPIPLEIPEPRASRKGNPVSQEAF